MKRKIFAAVLIMILMSLSVAGTYAYHVSRVVTHNVITSGNVNIRLDEWAEGENGDRVPFENGAVMPGETVSKIPEVTNTGSAPAYVRMYARISGAEETDVTLNINTEQWTEKRDDGYYYYREALQPGETAAPLFTTVSFSENMGNEYQNATITVDVGAHAVQTANQNVTNPWDALGWPAVK